LAAKYCEYCSNFGVLVQAIQRALEVVEPVSYFEEVSIRWVITKVQYQHRHRLEVAVV
jgi:hypothetical protein